MTSLARDGHSSGALFDLSGTIATNATWTEDIYFSEAGAPFTLTGLSFKMTFRCNDENTSADFTLSTDAGTLVITTDDNSVQVLRINVAAGALNSYEGEYVADLASRDANGLVILWAHGIITFRPNPVTF